MSRKQNAIFFILFSCLVLTAAISLAKVDVFSSKLEAYAFRLHPNQDLLGSIVEIVETHHLDAVSIQTCVGSLKRVVVRLANQSHATIFQATNQTYEIVSLVGTVSANILENGKREVIPHIHLSFSNGIDGSTFGGHLLDGSIIYTTAEIVITDLKQLRFTREIDPMTGYDELVIVNKKH
ncbi:hypothetical protein ABK040_000023 [Willaertia magna]